jgi:hypothetical protein
LNLVHDFSSRDFIESKICRRYGRRLEPVKIERLNGR